jgi:CelD/BcsL family acetyltransferase involved in cellulose biosynthesis
VRIHTDSDEVNALSAAWNACAVDALAPIGTNLHPWLGAAFQHLRKTRPVSLLTVWRGHVLSGAVALEKSRWRWGFPCRVSKTWQHPLAFEGMPLIAAAGSSRTVDMLLASHGGAALLLNAIPFEGPFLPLLQARAKALNAPLAMLDRRERAALTPVGSFTTWFQSNIANKRRREFRRQRARLGEQGNLESLQWRRDTPVQSWLDEFAHLENKGWKGIRGTACRQDSAVMAALGAALPALAAQRNLRFWKIALDGRPIAMMFAIASGNKAWLTKCAYDEDFAKYSPGVLLDLDATESLLAEERFDVVDSCAIPGHSMENIWRDRIGLVDILVGRPGGSHTLFAVMVAAERLRRRAREMAKSAFYGVTRRRRS